MRFRTVPTLLVVILLVPVVAGAQSPPAPENSRAAVIANAQAEKAKTLQPYVPSAFERKLLWLKREFLEQPSGFYPYFASVYSGGGFTLGAGYRRYYGDRTQWNLRGLYSIKGYKSIEFSTDSVGHGVGRFDWHARAGWMDATQVAFYGLSIDSPDARTSFRLKEGYVGANMDLRPVPWIVFGAGATYEDYKIEEGLGYPSIETVHTPATAPGLGAIPSTSIRPGPLASTGDRRLVTRVTVGSIRSRITTTTIATPSTASTGSMPRSSSTCQS